MTTLRVFVNAAPVDVSASATALDCVQRWRPEEAEDVRAGRRIITDSRGLPVPNDTAARAGSIFRTVSNRAADAGTRE
jgi:hypothetical protein